MLITYPLIHLPIALQYVGHVLPHKFTYFLQCVGHISFYTLTNYNTICWPCIPPHIYILFYNVLAMYYLIHLPIIFQCVGQISFHTLADITQCVVHALPHTITNYITICWPYTRQHINRL